jgi:hypothetical protein
MRTRIAGLAALAFAAATLATVAAAAPTSTTQRIMAKSKEGQFHTFVLRPRSPGPIVADSGTWTSCCWSRRFITRDGQRIEINDPLNTFTGKHGTLGLRFRIEWLDAGNGYSIGVATWKVVGGTGAYKGVTGSGRSAAYDMESWRMDGFLQSAG